jgi:hypothetical protein
MSGTTYWLANGTLPAANSPQRAVVKGGHATEGQHWRRDLPFRIH